jgi:hypothetical protein
VEALMTSDQGFGDPVVAPGPNLRSRFVDTEEVSPEGRELVDGEDGQHPELTEEQRRTIAALPRELPSRPDRSGR